MRRTGCLLSVLAVTALAGCDNDEVVPRAEFRRPSGMTFIERLVRLDCPPGPLLDAQQFEAVSAIEGAAGFVQPVNAEIFDPARSGILQGMLLVADSEAEGIRVQQYFQQAQYVWSGASPGTIQQIVAQEAQIVPGPTVFFPLVLAAPGFPTKVVESKDLMTLTNTCTYPGPFLGADGTEVLQGPIEVDISATVSRGSRSFVLAQEGGAGGGTSAIHIIDSRPRPYPARSQQFVNFGLGSIDLGQMPETAGPWTSVDLEAVAFRGCEVPEIEDTSQRHPCDETGVDVLALVQDAIGVGDGRLILMTVDRRYRPPGPNDEAPEFPPQSLVVPLPENTAPTDVVILEDRIVIANAATFTNADGVESSFVVVVPYAVSDAGEVSIGAPETVDVGGPTSEVVDAEELGVFAIRLDKPRVVYLENRGGQLQVFGRPLASPFVVDADPLNAARNGQIDLRNSPVLAAQVGRIDVLCQQVPNEPRTDALGFLKEVTVDDPCPSVDEDFPVLLLAYADGIIHFVAGGLGPGQAPRLAALRENRVLTVQRIEPDDRPDDDPTNGDEDVQLVGCDRPFISASGVDAPDPDGFAPACYPATSEPLDCEPDAADDFRPILESTPTAVRYRVSYQGPVFEDNAGRADVDTIALPIDGASTSTYTLELSTFEAPVGAQTFEAAQPFFVEGDRILLQMSLESTSVEADEEEEDACEAFARNLEYTLTDWNEDRMFVTATSTRTRCGVGARFRIRRLEVYPPEGDDSAVYSRIVSGNIGEVLRREDPDPVELANGGLQYTFTSSPTDTLEAQVRVILNPFNELRSEGRICAVGTDCPEDFNCLLQTRNEVVGDALAGQCFNRCTATSACTNCEDYYRARSGVEFFVDQTQIASAELAGSLSGRGSRDRLALPEDAVFSPMRNSWLISVPGTRSVAEVAPLADSIGVGVTR